MNYEVIRIIFNLLGKEDNYMEWDAYRKRVEFLNHFAWQQSVRRRSMANI